MPQSLVWNQSIQCASVDVLIGDTKSFVLELKHQICNEIVGSFNTKFVVKMIKVIT